MIVNFNRAPQMSLYYIGANILKHLNGEFDSIDNIYKRMNDLKIGIEYFYYAIDWLFLIEKVELKDNCIKRI